MAAARKTDSGVVYSTDHGRVCPSCAKPAAKCICREIKKQSDAQPKKDGSPVRLRLERKGRNGKDVTVITGLPLGETQMLQLAKELKQKCGAGGAVKDRTIEIQGDHRTLIIAELAKRGFSAK